MAELSRYYASARTVLLVRLDPHTSANIPPDLVFSEVKADPDLTARRTAASPERQLLRSAFVDGGGDLARAAATLTSRDGLSLYLDAQPTRSSRKVTSYRTPDELEITLPFQAFPLDSRIVRAVLAFHYEGTVDAVAYSRGEIVPAIAENLRFVGLVDDWADTHGEDDNVSLRCRDLTALLIDTKIPPNIRKKIEPGRTIVEVVQALLNTCDDFALFRPVIARTSEPLPTLDRDRYPRLAVPPKARHGEDRGDRGYILRPPTKAGGGEGESYWDAITDLCVSHALVPTVELDRIVLVEPRTHYTGAPVTAEGTQRFPRPGGHRESIGDLATTRRMVFGRNVLSIARRRKLGRVKAPTVRVSSVDPGRSGGRLISAQYPPGKRASKVAAAGAGGTQEVYNMIVRGVRDEAQLLTIARQAWETIGRQELGLTLQTQELASWSDAPRFDPNKEPDLLAIRAGDPVQVLVDIPSGGLATLSELQRSVARAARVAQVGGGRPEYADAVRFLVAQGWHPENARALARVFGSAALMDTFRVAEASVTYSSEDGFAVTIDMRDFVRVRVDPQGGAPGEPPVTSSGSAIA